MRLEPAGPTPRVYVATVMRPEGETGVQAHVAALRAAAARNGMDIGLITPFQLPRTIVYPTFGVGRLMKPVNAAFWVWWHRASHRLLLREQLRRTLHRDVRAVVYAQCPLSADAALEARRHGYPVEVVMAVHFNGSQAEEWAEMGFIRRGGRIYRQIVHLEERVLPAVDRLVFPSRYMRDDVARRISGLAGVPARCVPNFSPRPEVGASSAIRAELLSIGTLEPRKNHEYLLRVLAAAHRMGRPYRLTVAGAGPLREWLTRRAEDFGISDHVELLGHVPNAAKLLPAHRAYVHGAVLENMPIALVEALAAGRPVFAPPVGGIPEIFSDGVEGHLWDLADAAGAARLLIRLLEDPARYAAASAAALARYEACYSPERVFPELFEAIVGRNAPVVAMRRGMRAGAA